MSGLQKLKEQIQDYRFHMNTKKKDTHYGEYDIENHHLQVKRTLGTIRRYITGPSNMGTDLTAIVHGEATTETVKSLLVLPAYSFGGGLAHTAALGGYTVIGVTLLPEVASMCVLQIGLSILCWYYDVEPGEGF